MAEKVVLVTGTSSGFGLLASVALAEAGFRVIATMRNLGKQERLLAAAKEAGVTVDVRQLDVTDAESIRRCREYVEKDVGRLDVLVNNAGYGLLGAVEDMSADQLRLQIETNLVGVAEVTKAFLPMMRRQRSGRILNVTSMGGRTTFPFFAPYHASKWGLEGLSEAWSYELKPFGIDVAIIEPGAFKTEFDQGSMVKIVNEAGPYARAVEAVEKRAEPFRDKMGDPKHVARAIVRVATTRRPRLRNPVGADAWFILVLRTLLPMALFRRVLAAAMAVPKSLP